MLSLAMSIRPSFVELYLEWGATNQQLKYKQLAIFFLKTFVFTVQTMLLVRFCGNITSMYHK